MQDEKIDEPSVVSNLLKTALSYLQMGFSIIPVSGKESMVKWKEFQTRLPTKEEVEKWFFELEPTGIAIVCGKVSNVVILDIEASHGDITNLNIPKTPTVRSGGGGFHFYFKYPESGSIKSINLRQKMKIEGELKSDGTIVVVPPSRHPSGGIYKWQVPFEEADLVDIPEWLLSPQMEEREVEVNQQNDWEYLLEGVDEGSRNTSATKIIGKLLRYIPPHNWDEFVWPLVEMVNDKNNPPLPDEELRVIFESLVRKESARQTTENNLSHIQEILSDENFKLKPISLNELLIRELPEIQWTIDQLIPEAGLAVLSAPPAHHKTWMALYFAIQVANGDKIFDRFATKKCNVLFVEEDSNDRLITLRVKKLSSLDKDASLHFLFRCGLKFDDSRMMDEFIKFIKENNIGFVVFDSLIQFHNRDENINKDMALVFGPLKKITNMGVSVLVLHHHRKESGDENNLSWRDRSQSLRGASMILSLLNSHLVIHRQSQNKSILRQTKLWEREEMKPLEFELIDEGEKVVIRCLGEIEKEKDKKTLAKEAILANLNEESLTRSQLAEKLKDIASESIVANLVAEMKRNKEIIVVMKIGKKGRVEQYGLPDDDPDFNNKEAASNKQAL